MSIEEAHLTAFRQTFADHDLTSHAGHVDTIVALTSVPLFGGFRFHGHQVKVDNVTGSSPLWMALQ
ncbi:hypothetical protein A9762_04040 [Pandoraea sp. ISTKB]|nr:hypothetical protein A9762_04040 [Pandoraea sp. ISTKB]